MAGNLACGAASGGPSPFKPMESVTYLIFLLLAAAWVYQLLALISLARFFGSASRTPTVTAGPGVTIFKPLKGLEPGARECLVSFLTQDYQPYQVLFGVKDPQDPVLPLLKELQQAFAPLDIHIVICPEDLGLNPKISSLRQMEPRAQYDLLVVADGDVKVAPDYLGRVVAALQQPGVGLVSCPYRSGPVETLGAGLEALTLAADFIPSVAVAGYVEEIRFALGAAMALSRQALQLASGFAPLADFLADDYQLGLRVAQAGLQVKILPYVVETHKPVMGVKDYLAHQLRWARTYRVCRPRGYLAYGITHALIYALALALTAHLAPWALGVLGATLTLRWVLAYFSERYCLKGKLPGRVFWLLPIKDLLSFGLWLLSFLGDQVSWGQRRYRVTPEGTLAPES